MVQLGIERHPCILFNSADLHVTPKGVEKIKINSKTNTVQNFDNENPTPSEMDFDINSV